MTKRQVWRRAAAFVLLCGVSLAWPAAAADEPDFNPMELILQGNQAMAAGDLETANEVFTRGIENPQASDRFRVSFHLGRARVRAVQGQLEKALEDADAAVSHLGESEPNIARGNVYAIRGMMRAEAGRRADAIADLEAASRLLQEPDEEYAEMLNNMMQTRPEHARRLRQQRDVLLRTVAERLKALGAANP